MSQHYARRPETQHEGRPRTAAERVRDLSHLVALVADELEALEQEDFARLRELHGMRAKLAEESSHERDPETPALEGMLEELLGAVGRVEGWFEGEERSRSRLAELTDGSLPLVRGLQRPHGSGSYPLVGPADPRLDLRL